MNLRQGEQMGFIVQDLEKWFPPLVKTIADKEDNEKVAEYQRISYIGLKELFKPVAITLLCHFTPSLHITQYVTAIHSQP